MSPHHQLTADQVQALQEELDRLRATVQASLGAEDAAYIRRVVRIQRATEAAGRALIGLGIGPLSWMAGVTALSVAKILENMEIGHNVMHGQWDWMNDPTLCSTTYEWDIANASDDWRKSHNLRHHAYTNVLGLDHDFGYGVFRMTDEQPWNRFHRFQMPWNGFLALNFQWGIGTQELGLNRWLSGKIDGTEVRRRAGPFLRKASRQLFKDYALFPLLTPWNAPRVIAGNFVANMARNVWTHTIIFCGHFTEDVQTFSREEVAGETRGDWYLRQILGSSNIEGGRLLNLLSGHLSFQIEHHLFPDLPSSRYPELAEGVQAICARYGIPYNTGSLATQYGEVLQRIWRYSSPNAEPLPA